MKISLKTGLVLGFIVGVASALMYTPKSGKEIREELKDKVSNVPYYFFNFLESLIDLTVSVLDFAKASFKEQRQRLYQAVASGISAAKEKTDELRKLATTTSKQ